MEQLSAIITGGGTGIGKATALLFAKNGFQVNICGRRPEPLEEVRSLAKQTGGEIIVTQADVSKRADVSRVVNASINAFGRIHVLVNNAGVDGQGYIHEHDISLWEKIIAINLNGPFMMCREVIPHMRDAKKGHIINISSEAGLKIYEGSGAYGVAKNALNYLGEIIQLENQDFNIRVDTICPGMVVTEMTRDLSNLNHKNSIFPEDLAETILWLVSLRDNIKIGTPILYQTMRNPWSFD